MKKVPKPTPQNSEKSEKVIKNFKFNTDNIAEALKQQNRKAIISQVHVPFLLLHTIGHGDFATEVFGKDYIQKYNEVTGNEKSLDDYLKENNEGLFKNTCKSLGDTVITVNLSEEYDILENLFSKDVVETLNKKLDVPLDVEGSIEKRIQNTIKQLQERINVHFAACKRRDLEKSKDGILKMEMEIVKHLHSFCVYDKVATSPEYLELVQDLFGKILDMWFGHVKKTMDNKIFYAEIFCVIVRTYLYDFIKTMFEAAPRNAIIVYFGMLDKFIKVYKKAEMLEKSPKESRVTHFAYLNDLSTISRNFSVDIHGSFEDKFQDYVVTLINLAKIIPLNR